MNSIPHVIDSVLPNPIDLSLAEGLDEDGLLRLKSVSLTVELFQGKNMTPKEFESVFTIIYNFLKNGKS